MPEHPNPPSHQLSLQLKGFFSSMGKTLISLLAIAAVSLILVLPTWYLAVTSPAVYTWGVVLAAALAMTVAGLLRVRRETRKTGMSVWLKEIFLPSLSCKIPSFYLVVTGMGALIFIVMELPAPAALSGLLFFLGLGLHLFR